MLRLFLRFFCVVAILAFLLAVSAVGFLIYLDSPPAGTPPVSTDESLRIEEDGSLYLEVRNGESADSVGRRLEQAGVIRSRYFWQLLSRIKSEYIRFGVYRIELPASQKEIHSLLLSGDQILIKVTIPEGVTLKKTSSLLEEAGICPAEDFLKAASQAEMLASYRINGRSMEGYLYPDTYLFPLSFPAEKVVREMAGTFFMRLSENFPASLFLSAAELNERIIMASIIEREYRVEDEADLMAGVFYNRLGINMSLQSCATVEYIITEIEGRPHPEVLYNRDLEIRSPYNTYLNHGLPPGPISAPGRIALNAAFNPRPSNYLYFRLVDAGAGRHYFSATFDEHIRAGALYVKRP